MVKRRFKRSFKRRYKRRRTVRRRSRRTFKRRFSRRLRVRKNLSLRQPLAEIVRMRWPVNVNKAGSTIPLVPAGGPVVALFGIRPHSIYDPNYAYGAAQTSVQRYSEYVSKYRGMRVLGLKGRIECYFPTLTSYDADDIQVTLWTHPFYYDDYNALPASPDFRSYLGSPWLSYKKTTLSDAMSKDCKLRFTYKRKQFKMDNTPIAYDAVNTEDSTVLHPIFLQLTGPIAGTENYAFPQVLVDGYLDFLVQFNNPKTEALQAGT